MSGTPVDLAFEVINRSGQTLNFRIPVRSIFLEIGGTRYAGCNSTDTTDYVRFEDFEAGKSRSFKVSVRLAWSTFQTMKLDGGASYYVVGVDGFSPRLPFAAWREELTR